MKNKEIYSKTRRLSMRRKYEDMPPERRAETYIRKLYLYEVIDEGNNLNDKNIINRTYKYVPEVCVLKYDTMKSILHKIKKDIEDKREQDEKQTKLF